MGLTQEHLLGRKLQFWAKKETVQGTQVYPSAADSSDMRVLSSSFSHVTNRKTNTSSFMTYRDVVYNAGVTGGEARITGKTENSWSIETYLYGGKVSSATLTSAPTYGKFIECLFCAAGVASDSGAPGGGNDRYTYSLNSITQPSTLSLYRHFVSPVATSSYNAGLFQEFMAGAWVDEMKISVTGTDAPKISFSGGSMKYGSTVAGTVGVGSATTSLVVAAGSADFLNVGSTILFYDSNGATFVNGDNTSAGFVVNAVPTSTTATLNGSIHADFDDSGDLFYPFMPPWTDIFDGNPLNGLTGSITVNSETFPITGLDLTVKQNIRPFADVAFEKNVSDIGVGFFDVSGVINLRVRVDLLDKLQKRENADGSITHIPIVVTIGDTVTSGKQNWVITMPKCELGFAEYTTPESDEVTMSLPFIAMASSGNDAISMALTLV